MSGESHEVIHPKFRMWLRPDGIVQLVWRSGAELGLEDAVAAIDAMTKLTDGRRSPLLVDIHDAGQQDRAARMEFVRAGGLVLAVALLVSTPLSRMMGNFFLTVSKPTTPTRLFDDEAAAVAWFKEIVG